MNTTNRAVNRLILFLVGAVLVAVGAAVVSSMLWSVAGETWSSTIALTVDWMRKADRASVVADSAPAVSWFLVALLVLLVLVVACAVAVIARLGGGRSSAVIREEAASGPQGSVTIHPGFASDAIMHTLTSKEEILSSRVSARHLGGADVLHVSVTPRQNTSPVVVAAMVTSLVDNLAVLTGRTTPTLVSIHSGIRSHLAADRPRVDREEPRLQRTGDGQ